MDVALLSGKLQFALVYADNLVVSTCSASEDIDHVMHLLTLLRVE